MAEEVARLVAVVEANLKGFTKGMEQAQKIADQRFGAIERRMKTTEKKFGAEFSMIGTHLARYLSVAAITAFTRSLIISADRLADTAAQIGITTQELQEFQYVARVTGGNAEGMANALGFLNDRLGDAAKGEGELAEVMREFNIPMGTASQVVLDLADATKNAETQAERARISTAAFGKAGKDNITFLSQGAAGIRAYADEAHRLNQVWDEETVAKLDAMNESLTTLGATLTTFAAGPIATGLGGLSTAMANIATEAERLRNSGWVEYIESLGRVGLGFMEGGMLGAGRAAMGSPKSTYTGVFPLPDAPPARTGAPPPPKPGAAGDPEREMLKFLGLPDLPSGEKFMEMYWQAQANAAAAAWGAGALDRAHAGPGPMITTDMALPGNAPIDTQAGDLATDFADLNEATGELRNGLISVGLAAAHGFGDMEEAASRALSRLGDMIIEIGVLRPLMDFLMGPTGGASGSGLIGKIFGFAGGGTIPRGSWGLVGEKGPELAFSGAGGTRVLPNSVSMPALRGGGQSAQQTIINVDARGAQQGVAEQIASALAAALPSVVGASVKVVQKNLPGMMANAQKRVG